MPTIYSEVGQGTTFKLYLPRYRGEEPSEEPAAGAVMRDRLAERGETVLVVEDEPVVRGLIVEVLERSRLPRASRPSTARKACEILQSPQPHRPADHRCRPARPERPPDRRCRPRACGPI